MSIKLRIAEFGLWVDQPQNAGPDKVIPAVYSASHSCQNRAACGYPTLNFNPPSEFRNRQSPKEP